ncbi:hypothetical protein BHE74_00027231 [Ensete ventricosum]|nr:hypothetical protein GW17_00010449 [Ensete ventricosum]RWW65505.1 hypothetical protein BHE74_00027231 [Ensete ventricosum]
MPRGPVSVVTAGYRSNGFDPPVLSRAAVCGQAGHQGRTVPMGLRTRLPHEATEGVGRDSGEISRLAKTTCRFVRKLAKSQELLDDSESQLRNAMTQVRQMETELLELTRAKDALRADLPRQAIEDYKKSLGFETGLVRMGRVSLEYEYQLALARLQARYLGLEIEVDSFTLLPEDANVPMADEQPFDDLPPIIKE